MTLHTVAKSSVTIQRIKNIL